MQLAGVLSGVDGGPLGVVHVLVCSAGAAMPGERAMHVHGCMDACMHTLSAPIGMNACMYVSFA